MKIGIIGAGEIGGTRVRRLDAGSLGESWRQQPDMPVQRSGDGHDLGQPVRPEIALVPRLAIAMPLPAAAMWIAS